VEPEAQTVPPVHPVPPHCPYFATVVPPGVDEVELVELVFVDDVEDDLAEVVDVDLAEEVEVDFVLLEAGLEDDEETGDELPPQV